MTALAEKSVQLTGIAKLFVAALSLGEFGVEVPDAIVVELLLASAALPRDAAKEESVLLVAWMARASREDATLAALALLQATAIVKVLLAEPAEATRLATQGPPVDRSQLAEGKSVFALRLGTHATQREVPPPPTTTAPVDPPDSET